MRPAIGSPFPKRSSTPKRVVSRSPVFSGFSLLLDGETWQPFQEILCYPCRYRIDPRSPKPFIHHFW